MTNEDPRLPELNQLVTVAILRAEHLPPGVERERAFVIVGQLEEAIAEICPAGTTEGDIARRGAVTAALSSGEPLKALLLATKYLKEPTKVAGMEMLRAEALRAGSAHTNRAI